MSKADDLLLVWREKAREAREAGKLWMAAPAKPCQEDDELRDRLLLGYEKPGRSPAKPCQEDDELRDRAAFAWDERAAAWKAFMVAEWNEIA